MNNRLCGIYGVLHKPSSRWYVGCSRNIEDRWYKHKQHSKYSYGTYFHRALLKYHKDEFLWMTIELCDIARFPERETYWIQKLHSYRSGFNETMGGEIPITVHPHIARKISITKTGHKVSEETRNKISTSMKKLWNNQNYRKHQSDKHKLIVGIKHPNYGKKATPELRKKLSESHLGQQYRRKGKINSYRGQPNNV